MPSRRFLPDDEDDDEPEPVRGPDGRWPTVDRVERAIRFPGAFGAHGWFRDELIAQRGQAERELAEVDAQLAAATRRRRQLTTRIRNCNLAIVGTSEIRDRDTGELVQLLPWGKRIPFHDPLPPIEPRRARIVSGSTLRAALLDLLEVTDQQLTIAELHRLLRLRSLLPAGRPSQTISNALQVEVRAGRVERTARGRYRLAPRAERGGRAAPGATHGSGRAPAVRTRAVVSGCPPR